MARPFQIDWWPNRVVFEAGSVGRLGELAAELGRRRAFVVCGRSVAAGALLERVKAGLGRSCCGVFAELEMHSPMPVLERAVGQAQKVDADLLVSVGGGSAIDSAKGIALMDAAGGDYLRYALAPPPAPVPKLERKPRLAHIAIPTTSGSGSEVAPTFGLRDPAEAKKRTFRQMALIPDIALLDPGMTASTPARLAAASGMTAVARCIESLYSGRRNPLYAGISLQALRMLGRSLATAVRTPEDDEARADCQIAATLSAVAANANVSAVHAVGHVVGGRYGLQHGVSHAMLLAPAMRLLMPAIGEQQRQVLEALGGAAQGMSADQAGMEAASRVATLAGSLPLPSRLREVGVARDDLRSLAEHAGRDPIMLTAAAPVTEDRIRALLEEVW